MAKDRSKSDSTPIRLSFLEKWQAIYLRFKILAILGATIGLVALTIGILSLAGVNLNIAFFVGGLLLALGGVAAKLLISQHTKDFTHTGFLAEVAIKKLEQKYQLKRAFPLRREISIDPKKIRNLALLRGIQPTDLTTPPPTAPIPDKVTATFFQGSSPTQYSVSVPIPKSGALSALAYTMMILGGALALVSTPNFIAIWSSLSFSPLAAALVLGAGATIVAITLILHALHVAFITPSKEEDMPGSFSEAWRKTSTTEKVATTIFVSLFTFISLVALLLPIFGAGQIGTGFFSTQITLGSISFISAPIIIVFSVLAVLTLAVHLLRIQRIQDAQKIAINTKAKKDNLENFNKLTADPLDPTAPTITTLPNIISALWGGLAKYLSVKNAEFQENPQTADELEVNEDVDLQNLQGAPDKKTFQEIQEALKKTIKTQIFALLEKLDTPDLSPEQKLKYEKKSQYLRDELFRENETMGNIALIQSAFDAEKDIYDAFFLTFKILAPDTLNPSDDPSDITQRKADTLHNVLRQNLTFLIPTLLSSFDLINLLPQQKFEILTQMLSSHLKGEVIEFQQEIEELDLKIKRLELDEKQLEFNIRRATTADIARLMAIPAEIIQLRTEISAIEKTISDKIKVGKMDAGLEKSMTALNAIEAEVKNEIKKLDIKLYLDLRYEITNLKHEISTLNTKLDPTLENRPDDEIQKLVDAVLKLDNWVTQLQAFINDPSTQTAFKRGELVALNKEHLSDPATPRFVTQKITPPLKSREEFQAELDSLREKREKANHELTILREKREKAEKTPLECLLINGEVDAFERVLVKLNALAEEAELRDVNERNQSHPKVIAFFQTPFPDSSERLIDRLHALVPKITNEGKRQKLVALLAPYSAGLLHSAALARAKKVGVRVALPPIPPFKGGVAKGASAAGLGVGTPKLTPIPVRAPQAADEDDGRGVGFGLEGLKTNTDSGRTSPASPPRSPGQLGVLSHPASPPVGFGASPPPLSHKRGLS